MRVPSSLRAIEGIERAIDSPRLPARHRAAVEQPPLDVAQLLRALVQRIFREAAVAGLQGAGRPKGSGSCTTRGGPSARTVAPFCFEPGLLRRFLGLLFHRFGYLTLVAFFLIGDNQLRQFFSPKAWLDRCCCTTTAEMPSKATSAAATTVAVSV